MSQFAKYNPANYKPQKKLYYYCTRSFQRFICHQVLAVYATLQLRLLIVKRDSLLPSRTSVLQKNVHGNTAFINPQESMITVIIQLKSLEKRFECHSWTGSSHVQRPETYTTVQPTDGQSHHGGIRHNSNHESLKG